METCALRTLTQRFLLIRVRTQNILRIQVMNICSIHVHIISTVVSRSPSQPAYYYYIVVLFILAYALAFNYEFCFDSPRYCCALLGVRASKWASKRTGWLAGLGVFKRLLLYILTSEQVQCRKFTCQLCYCLSFFRRFFGCFVPFLRFWNALL